MTGSSHEIIRSLCTGIRFGSNERAHRTCDFGNFTLIALSGYCST
jgi:hypothetical protein